MRCTSVCTMCVCVSVLCMRAFEGLNLLRGRLCCALTTLPLGHTHTHTKTHADIHTQTHMQWGNELICLTFSSSFALINALDKHFTCLRTKAN